MKAKKTRSTKSATDTSLLSLPKLAASAVAAKAEAAQKVGNAAGSGPVTTKRFPYEIDCGLVQLLQSTYVSPAGVSLGLLGVAKIFFDVSRELSADDNEEFRESVEKLSSAAKKLFALTAGKAQALARENK
ncbi:MAG TPA: hypothetical protein VF573_02040 [Paraburkholderia sp.]|uniref:hypothetical protein n=1 Tax=Paraburkholderia sp. TaxID=1926495 RepID=UPI002ED20D55